MRFFFYGTLIAGSGNRVAAALQDKLVCLGPAAARGRLYAVSDGRGHYPALLPGHGVVHGMLYETLPAFSRHDLAEMDAYEEYDPRRHASSLYHRRPIAIRVADAQTVRAQAYVYRRALPMAAKLIADGDFRAWLARTGAAAFGARR